MAFKVRQNSTFEFEVVVLQFLPRSAVRIKKTAESGKSPYVVQRNITKP